MNVDEIGTSLQEALALQAAGSYAEALNIYRDCAERGHSGCMDQVGWMYYKGQGVKPDVVTAKFWFEKAYASSQQEQSGICLGRILVAEGDYDRAFRIFRELARKRYPPAIYWVGRCYYNGWGPCRNRTRALRYVSVAAKYDHFLGARDRAKMLIKGLGHSSLLGRIRGVYELGVLATRMFRTLKDDTNDSRLFG